MLIHSYFIFIYEKHPYHMNNIYFCLITLFLNYQAVIGDNFSTLHYLFTKRQNFHLVQIESICRQKTECNLKTEILFGMFRRHCGKWRKCWLPAFSPFPTMFSKAVFSRGVKSQDCVRKSYLPTKFSTQLTLYRTITTNEQDFGKHCRKSRKL